MTATAFHERDLVDQNDAHRRAADANTLVDAAARYALLDDELTHDQAATVDRLFPARDGEDRIDYLIRVAEILEAIADDVRPHWHYEQGLELRGEWVHESDAIRHLDSARWYAGQCIAAGGVA